MASRARLICVDRFQVQMEAFCPDALVPGDHVVREVWEFVSRMDMGRLYEAIAARGDRPGAPAFDPKVLLCLWIYATLDGVGSARRLSRLTVESAPYRWITGALTVNYHTLADFRSKRGEEFDRLLAATVAVMAESGVIDPKNMTVAHDGMRVRASAGRSSFRTRGTIESLLEKAKERVARLRSEGQREDQNNPDGNGGGACAAARERSANRMVDRLTEALKTMTQLEARRRGTRQKKADRPLRVSTTDPHASILKMPNNGYDSAINVQLTTEVTTRMITSVHIVTHTGDNGTLVNAMEAHAKTNNGFLPTNSINDMGFFKYEDIAKLERSGCAVYMPAPANAKPASKQSRIQKQDQEMIARWRERMKDPKTPEIYKLRGSTVEWANSRYRQMGMTQLPVRGPAKARAVALLYGLAHNFQRIRDLKRGHFLNSLPPPGESHAQAA